MFPVQATGTTTIANLNQSSCDVKATTGGDLYCGTDTGGSGNAAWTIGTGLIYNATSTDEVGIGTSTPDYTLTIQGNGATNPFRIASSSGANLFTINTRGSTTLSSLGSGVIVGLSGELNTIAVLDVARGGTGTSTAGSAGTAAYYDGSTLRSTLQGTAFQVLRSNGADAPAFSDIGSLLTAGSNIVISGTSTIAVSSTPTFTTLTVTATTTLQAATTTINGVTMYWPSANPTGAKLLQNDGSGNLTWV